MHCTIQTSFESIIAAIANRKLYFSWNLGTLMYRAICVYLNTNQEHSFANLVCPGLVFPYYRAQLLLIYPFLLFKMKA